MMFSPWRIDLFHSTLFQIQPNLCPDQCAGAGPRAKIDANLARLEWIDIKACPGDGDSRTTWAFSKRMGHQRKHTQMQEKYAYQLLDYWFSDYSIGPQKLPEA